MHAPSLPSFAASSLEWTSSLLSSHSVLDYHHKHQLYPASSPSSLHPSSSASSSSLPSSSPSLARTPSLRRSESEIHRGEDDADAASQRTRGRLLPSSLATSDQSESEQPSHAHHLSHRMDEVSPLKLDAELLALIASWTSPTTPHSTSLHHPVLASPMYQRWVSSLSSFSLSSSSFGCLLDKRFAMLSDFVQEASRPAKAAPVHSLSPKKRQPPPSSSVPIAPPLHPSEFSAPVWPTLKGLDTESWPEGLDVLLQQLSNLPPLQLLAEHTPGEEVMELFTRLLSYIDDGDNSADPAVVQSGLSVMVAVAISRAAPQHLLHCIQALLHHPTVVFTDSIAPFLTTLAQHLNELDISAPFHLSALQSFIISTPSPSTSVSSYSARSPPLSLTLSPSHLYIHSASGLLKVGTGYSGSVANQHSIHSTYRQHEQLSIACVPPASALFVSAAHFVFPRVQLLDDESLKVKEHMLLGVDADAAPVVRGQAQLLTEGRWLYLLEVKETVKDERKEKEEKEGKEREDKADEAADRSEEDMDDERRQAQKQLQDVVIECERWLKQQRREGLDAAALMSECKEEVERKTSKLEGRISIMKDIRERLGARDERKIDRAGAYGEDILLVPASSSSSAPPPLLAQLAEAKDLLAQVRKDHRQHQRRKMMASSSHSSNAASRSSQASSSTPSGPTNEKKLFAFTLWKYDPLQRLPAHARVDEDIQGGETAEETRVREERRAKASEIFDAFSAAYPLSLCILALMKSAEDMNTACRWLSDHGEEWRHHLHLPLVQRIVLESDDVLSSITPDLLTKCTVLVTSHQLLLILPPHISSHTHDDDSLTRVYDVQSGRLLSEYQGNVGKQNQQAAYDAVNDIVWTVGSQGVNQMEATVYRNHGKGGVQPNREIPTSDDVLSSLGPVGEGSSGRSVAMFLLSQVDRHLRHLDITPLKQPPLVDLAMRAESLKAQSDSLAKERTQIQGHIAAMEAKEREMKGDGERERDSERDRQSRDRERERERQRERERDRERDMDDNELSEIIAATAGLSGSLASFPSLGQGSSPSSSALLHFIQAADDRAHSLDFNALLNRIVTSERSAFGALAPSSPSPVPPSLGSSSSSSSASPSPGPPTGAASLFHLAKLKRGPARAGVGREPLTRHDTVDRLSSVRSLELQCTAELNEIEQQMREVRERREHSRFVPDAGTLPFALELEDDTFSVLYELLDFHVKDVERLAQQRTDEWLERSSSTSLSPRAVLFYFLYVCLQLLQVHLETLLQDCASEQYPTITHLHPIRALLLHLGLSSSPSFASLPPLLRRCSISVLISGLRIFYPTQLERTRLLSELMQAGLRGAREERKEEFLRGVLAWFADERDVADALLVRNSNAEREGEKGESTRFIEVLVGFARDEFRKQWMAMDGKGGSASASSLLMPPGIPAMGKRQLSRSMSKSTSLSRASSARNGGAAGKASLTPEAPPLTPSPSLRLLLILLMDLITKSALLSTDPVTAKGSGSSTPPILSPSSTGRSSSSPISPAVYLTYLLDFAKVVLGRCDDFTAELAAEMSSAEPASAPALTTSWPEQLKNSILLLLTPLLTALSSPRLLASPLDLQDLLAPFTSLLSHLDSLNLLFPSHFASDSQYSLQLSGETTRSFQIETPHPYPSSPRVIKQTLTIPGATHIAWSFDPRSSSHNGSDALRFFYDPHMKYGMAVGPFFGNDKDGSGTWPRGTIITPGSSATICFSAKSPPKRSGERGGGLGVAGGRGEEQRWGFRAVAKGVIIRSLPWLLDLENQIAALGGRIASAFISGVVHDARESGMKTFLSLPILSAGLEPLANPPPPPRSDPNPRLSDPVSVFLLSFIDATAGSEALVQEMDRHSVTFPGKMVVKRLPAELRAAWDRALRALMAAMIKHAGLGADVLAAFRGEGEQARGEPSPLLVDRLKFVAVQAKGMQVWMIEQVQLHGEFDSWFEPGRMNVIYVHQRQQPSVTFDTAATDTAAAREKAESKEKELEEKRTEGKEAAADAPDYFPSDLCYDLTFTSAELKSEYASQPNKVKQFATLKRMPIRRIADHRINTAATSSLDPFTVTAATSSPLLSPALTPLSTPIPSGSPSIGSATVQAGSSTISFDVDLALEDLYKVMEAERALKQKQAREEPSKAYHLLELKERKLQTYQLVIRQVHDMALTLLHFQCNEKLSTSPPTATAGEHLRPPQSSSTASLSSIDGFSLDAPIASPPPLSQPTFARSHTDQVGLESIDESPPPPFTLTLAHAHAHSTVVPDTSASPPPPSITAPLQSRVNDLRSWVHSYQRFRSWQTTNQPFSVTNGSSAASSSSPKQSSPIDAVRLLLRENVDPVALVGIAQMHQARAKSRGAGLLLLWVLLRSVSFEVGRVEVVGLLVDAFSPASSEPSAGGGKGGEDDRVSVFSDIECATEAVKLEVYSRYERFALALLELLKQPLPASRPSGAAKPSLLSNPSSASSPLVLASSVPSSARLNYASRLLALSDVYSFPFVPLLLSTGASSSSSSASLLSLHGQLLFHVLSDAVAIKRLIGQIERAMSKESRRKDEQLNMSIAQQERRDGELAAAKAAVERVRQELSAELARKQAATAAGSAELPALSFFSILGKEDSEDWTLATIFDEPSDRPGAAQLASAEVADTRRMCRWGVDCFRRSPAHFIEFRHPVREPFPLVQRSSAQQPAPPSAPTPASAPVEQPASAEVPTVQPAEEHKTAEEEAQAHPPLPPHERNDGDCEQGNDDEELNQRLQSIVNRMGKAKSVAREGNLKEDEARKAKERRIFMRMSAADRDRNRRAMGLTGSSASWLDEDEGEADEKEGEIPSIEFVESILSSHQWAALRVLLVQLTTFEPAVIRQAMWKKSEAERVELVRRMRQLTSLVHSVLSKELLHCVALAFDLYEKEVGWAVRRKVLDSVEKLLTFYVVLFTQTQAPLRAEQSRTLATTLLAIFHHYQAFTPHLVQLAMRLARRVFSSLSPNALFASFRLILQQEKQRRAKPVVTETSRPTGSESDDNGLAGYLLSLIGGLLMEQQSEEDKQRRRQQQLLRLQRLRKEKARREKEDREATEKQRQASAAAAAATISASAPSSAIAASSSADSGQAAAETASSSTAGTAAAASASSAPPLSVATHSVFIHYQETLSSDFLSNLLAKPSMTDVLYGCKGAVAPPPEEVAAASIEAFQKRQLGRKGNARVGTYCKTGMVDISGEQRATCRAGFSTVMANVTVVSGRWYYQVHLNTRGLMQIGWATAAHNPNSSTGDGCGDDAHSWSYDGMRLKKWHAGSHAYSSSRWNVGDVVGCAVDLDAEGGAELKFFLNGEDLGVAFRHVAVGSGLLPAASLSHGESCTFVFDQNKMKRVGSMKSKIPDGYHPLENDRADTADPANIRQAGDIMRGVEYDGLHPVLSSDYAYCTEVAQRLANEGLLVTVGPVESSAPLDALEANAEKVSVDDSLDTLQLWKGKAVHDFASELIALARHLLLSSSPLSTLLKQRIQRILTTSQSPALILAASSVLGAFHESIRVGGQVTLSGVASARAVVVQYNSTSDSGFARVLLLSELHDQEQQVQTHRVKLADLTAVAELAVDLHSFPLTDDLYTALRLRSEQQPSDALGRALQQSSVHLLASLLSHSSSFHTLPAGMLTSITSLLLTRAQAVSQGLQLDSIAQLVVRLQERRWELKNGVDELSNILPFKSSTRTNAAPSAPSPTSSSSSSTSSPTDFLYSSSSYSDPALLSSSAADDAMLRYWDKHIIPLIQNYVRASFRPYEMENFFAQLRQPLKQNNNAAAVEIALTLCGNHVPEGVNLPDDNKDWNNLMLGDVEVGGRYEVSEAVRNSDTWVEEMGGTIGRVGRAKVKHPAEELVLLQFVDEREGTVEEWWYGVEVLRKPTTGGRRAGYEGVRDLQVVERLLTENEPALSSLLARRALFSLCSRSFSSSQSFLASQLQQKGLESVLHFIFLSASESLDLSSLTALGCAVPSQKERMWTLQNNLGSFLSSAGVSPSQVQSLVVEHIGHLLLQSASFTSSNAATTAFSVIAQAVDPFMQMLEVSSACLLVLLFAKDCRLSAGSTLTLYSDADLSDSVRVYVGKDEATAPLHPVIVPSSQCYLQLTKPNDVSSRGSVRVLPVAPSLALSVWLMEWMLSESMDWLVDGRCAALCYDFAASVLQHFQLTHMQPSPLKEALLHLIARLLSQVHTEERALRSGGRGAVSGSAKRVRGGSDAKVLSALKELKGEMVELYEKREAGSDIYSSYLQQLLDVLIASDELRAPEERLVPAFHFPLPLTADEEKKAKEEEEKKKALEAAEWSCPSCTFANPVNVQSCEMCSTPKPKQTQIKKAEGKAVEAMKGTDVLHHLSALVACMRFLNEEVELDDSPAVNAIMEHAWEEVRRDQLETRMIVIDNMPTGDKDAVKAAIIACVQAAAPTLHVLPSHLHLYSDPSRQPIPPVLRRSDSRGGKKERDVFEYKRPFDEGGVLYHLGSISHDSTWQNPHETKLVVCSASSTDGTSHVRSIISRFATHFSTKPSPKSWVCVEYAQHALQLSHYTLRNTDAPEAKNLALRWWKLEASKDGKAWATLDERSHDPSLANKSQPATFIVPPSPAAHQFYSFFRLTQTGANAGGTHALSLGGVEMYGKLRKRVQKGDAVSTPFLCVLELHVNDRKLKDKVVAALNACELPLYLRDAGKEEDRVETDKKERDFSAAASSDRPVEEDDDSLDLSGHFEDDDDDAWLSPSKRRQKTRASKSERSAERQRRREQAEKKERDSKEEREMEEMSSRVVQLRARHYKEVPTNESAIVYHLLSKLTTDAPAVSNPVSPSSSFSSFPSSAFASSSSPLQPAFVSAVNAIVAPFAFSDVPGVPRLSSKGVESVLSYGSLYASPAPLLSLMKQLLTKVEADATVSSSSILDMLATVFSPSAISKLSLSTLSALLSSVYSWLTAAGFDLHLRPHAFPNLDLALASQRSGWPIDGQRQLIDRLHAQVEDAGGEETLLTFQPTQLVFSEGDEGSAEAELSRLPPSSLNLPALRLRFTLLRKFNSLFSQLLPLIDLRLSESSSCSLSSLVQQSKPFIFSSVKNAFIQLILSSSSVDSKPPRISVNRPALSLRKQRGDYIDFVKHSNFGNGFRQLFDLPASSLRPPRPHGTEPFLGFEVEFQQEQVVGEGGPYRQYFSDVGRELVDQSPQSASPLFIACPNKQSQVGDSRDKFVIAPAATSSLHLQMFEFVGLLFGLCIRTGVRLPIDLPSFVWKPLVGDELTAEDLFSIDMATSEYLKLIDTAEADTLQHEIHQSFTTALSDQSIVELLPNGANTFVTHANRMQYVQLVVAARLSEHTAQVAAILRGIARILPTQLLNMLSWAELSVLIAGKPEIDVELLRRHTEYSGCSESSPHIRMFWQLVQQFDQQHRRLLIRFAWAQDRLPANDEEFNRSHVRLLIKPPPYPARQHDSLLPRSDTCFFNLEVPAYSSAELMREKLLYAITTCSTMNADQHVEDIHGGRGGRTGGGGGGGGSNQRSRYQDGDSDDY